MNSIQHSTKEYSFEGTDGLFMTSGFSTSPVTSSSPRLGADFDNDKCEVLQQQADQGNLVGLRQFLARTRQSKDWQDRYFVLDLVAPCVQPGSLDALCDTEPNSSDLSVIRIAHLFNMVSKSRGTKTTDRTTDQQFAQAGHYVKATIAALRHTIQLDSVDPTPHVFAIRAFQVFSDLRNHLHQTYQQAVQLAPDFVPAHFAMVNAQSESGAVLMHRHYKSPVLRCRMLGRAVTRQPAFSWRTFLFGNMPLFLKRTGNGQKRTYMIVK